MGVKSTLVSETGQPRRVLLTQQVLDSAGRVVARQQQRLTLRAGQAQTVTQALRLRQPRLWSPARPYLYRMLSTITEVGSGAVLEEASNPLGLRWYRFDAAQGFFLNGQPLQLMGASRHQDYAGLGNAVPKALAVRDVELLKEMGGNFLRIAHYPQDPAVLAACDRLGILASEEIPVVNQITESEAFFQNCKTMQIEMIRQGFNHPSVILWTYMNEILLSIRGQDMSDAKGQTYLRQVARLAQELDDLTHREDPGRLTMLAMHGDFNLYQKAGLTAIPAGAGLEFVQRLVLG
ncbi:MAG: glycoside hydrolase family 2 TIM barrel-domain containing protein [Hymenobacter sp.]